MMHNLSSTVTSTICIATENAQAFSKKLSPMKYVETIGNVSFSSLDQYIIERELTNVPSFNHSFLYADS